jgi:hypothetical protein
VALLAGFRTFRFVKDALSRLVEGLQPCSKFGESL